MGRRASMWSLRRAKLGGFRKALLTSGVIDPAPRKLSSAHPARPCGSVLTARAHVRAIRPVTRARADVSHGARYEYGVGPENGWRDGKGRAHAATPCGRAGARRAPHPPPLVEKCPSTSTMYGLMSYSYATVSGSSSSTLFRPLYQADPGLIQA